MGASWSNPLALSTVSLGREDPPRLDAAAHDRPERDQDPAAADAHHRRVRGRTRHRLALPQPELVRGLELDRGERRERLVETVDRQLASLRGRRERGELGLAVSSKAPVRVRRSAASVAPQPSRVPSSAQSERT